MRDIIEWLAKMEQSSSVYYKKLADLTNNQRLTAFLEKLSKEESEHYRYMNEGLHLIDEKGIDKDSEIIIDEKAQKKIENLVLSDTNRDQFTDEEIYEKIITIEFSEWNEIFLYATEFLKKTSPVYQQAASKIQEHLDGIRNYFSTLQNADKFLEKIESLDRIWSKNVLIVDDNESITSFLKIFCKRIGNVDIAHDGCTAFDMAKENYYDLIVSDIDMPSCDGIEFYKNLSGIDANLKKRFIFMSGNNPTGFIIDKGIFFIKKPFTVSEIIDRIEFIIPVH